MLQKIDIHHSDEDYKNAVEKLSKDLSKKNSDLIIKFLNDCSIGNRYSLTKKQVGVRGRLKALYLLKSTAQFLKKDFDKVTLRDMKKFVTSLNDNTFLSYNGKHYSEQTKSNIKKQFILFLRWYYKNNNKYRELTEWIDTRYKKKEKPSLKEEEVEMLVKKSNTLKQKILFAFLFDAGCRIEEFLNLRIGDLVKVEKDMPYYKVTFREEFSKTNGRTIGLFWKYSTDLVDSWLEGHEEKENVDSQFFPSTYDGVRVLLTKIGKRILNKPITPHLMRHSSATYYASRLNRQQLCVRYGWAFSSNMPDIYIQRAGVDDERISEEIKQERYSDLLDEITKLKETNKTLRESDKVFAEKFMKFLQVFKDNPKIAKQLAHKDLKVIKEMAE